MFSKWPLKFWIRPRLITADFLFDSAQKLANLRDPCRYLTLTEVNGSRCRNFFLKSIALILPIFTLLSCGWHLHPQDRAQADLSGVLTPRLAPLVSISPKPPKTLQALGKNLATRAASQPAAGKSPQSILQTALVHEIVDHKGLPRDQLTHILTDLVRPQNTACNGVSCGRIFNLKVSEIDGFLDQTYEQTSRSRSLTDPQNADERGYLLGSLGRLDDLHVKADLEKYLPYLSGDKSPTTGTCLEPASVAYPTPASEGRAGPSQPMHPRSIDYRNNRPKPFQGGTGSCHIFSMVSMIHHSHRPDLEKIGIIDPNRTFLDYWASSLGGDLGSAFERELSYLRGMATFRKDFVERETKAGLLPEMAHDKWRYRAQRPLLMYGQGGHAITDFLRFRLWGVVLEDKTTPTLSTSQLERLGADLAKARMQVVDALMEADLLDQEIYAIMKKPLEQVFDLAKENLRWRTPLKAELGHYTMEKVIFDRGAADESARKFFAALEKYGPLGISRNSHATTVVAYDRESRIFHVADSADRFGRDYTTISESALFSNLNAYYVMKQTTSPDN
jgi:hypothetical protein